MLITRHIKYMDYYFRNITIIFLILLVGCSRLPWKEEDIAKSESTLQNIDDEILLEEATVANVDQLYGLHNKQSAEINSHKEDIEYLEDKIDSLGLQVSNDMQSIRDMISNLTATVVESDKQRKIEKMTADTTKSIDAVTQLNMKVKLNKDRVEQYTMFFDSVRFDMNQRYVILDNEVSTLKKALIEYISGSEISVAEAPPEVSDKEFRQRYTKYYRHYINEDYDLSIAGFKELLAIDRNHDLSENCQYWMGEAYFAKGDYAIALKTFYDVFPYPLEKKEDDAQLKIGICYIKLDDNIRAKKELQNYVDQYPQGEFVSKAKSYLSQLD